jgi:hypothetical protein
MMKLRSPWAVELTGNAPDIRTRLAGNGNGRNGNGRHNGTMTASQRRAIGAIGRRLGLDVEAECRDEFGANLDELDVRTASKLIDHLKALQGNGAGNGNATGRGGRR